MQNYAYAGLQQCVVVFFQLFSLIYMCTKSRKTFREMRKTLDIFTFIYLINSDEMTIIIFIHITCADSETTGVSCFNLWVKRDDDDEKFWVSKLGWWLANRKLKWIFHHEGNFSLTHSLLLETCWAFSYNYFPKKNIHFNV